jgi:hypothetical protein
MKIIAAVIILIGAMAVLSTIVSAHDAALRRSASLYEECVKAEYGMTPIQWYEQHGKYPKCGN